MASIDKINVGGAEYGIKTTNPGYLECSTARSTAAKVVAATDFILDVGTMIAVRFTDTGSSNPSSGNLTLNVGDTGAKTIVDGHTNKTAVTYSSGAWFYNNIVNEFVYDGTYWVWLNRDNNTTYSGGSLYTSASKTGSGTTVTNTIASGTSMNNAIGTLLNNDVALNAHLKNIIIRLEINTIDTIEANSYKSITFTIPDGYSDYFALIGIYRNCNMSNNVVALDTSTIYFNDNKFTLALRNFGSTSATGYFRAFVILVKTNM